MGLFEFRVEGSLEGVEISVEERTPMKGGMLLYEDEPDLIELNPDSFTVLEEKTMIQLNQDLSKEVKMMLVVVSEISSSKCFEVIYK